MNPELILGLIHNIALLIAMGLLGGFYWKKEDSQLTLTDKFLTGLLLGGIGMVIMLTPWILVPGLVFDTRSVLLSVSGLFFGPIPTFTAILITGAYRLFTGGPGLWMGIGVIISSGIIGILWKQFRPGWKEKHPVLELLLLGLVVHLIMLSLTMLLPKESFLSTIKLIALPVLTIYPVGTILFGLLMLSRYKHYETKRALHRSEEKFRQLFEKSDVMMMLVEPETGQIIDANEAAARFYGYSTEKLRTMNAVELNTSIPDTASGMPQKALMNGVKYFEVHQRAANGEERMVEVHTSPIVVRDHTVLFSITHEITDRKKAEEALLSAKERAEESDRLKSTFLATMSHELRTPLNAIIGFSDLLYEGQETDNVQKFAKTILDSGRHLLSIIESIFDIALLQSKQSKVTITTFQLSEFFSNISQYLIIEKKRKKKQHLQSFYNPDPAYPEITIQSDRIKLIQLVSNLLNNALKYTYEGRIDYGYSVNDQDITIFVKDTGIGIPADKIKTVFKIFMQGDDSLTRKHGGMGLGLAICQEIANLLNGRLWIESEEGKGSAFFFKLDQVVVDGPGIQNKTNSCMPSPDLSHKTILIVDDLVDNTILLTRILAETKAQIISADSGNKAILLVQENPDIDLVLMDIKMPGLNGYDATRSIHSFRPKLPVIAQTAYAFNEDRVSAFAAGCTDFISKPIQKQKLFEILQKHFTN